MKSRPYRTLGLIFSAIAILSSLYGHWLHVNEQRAWDALPLICAEMRQNMPQNPQDVQDMYGITANRVTLIERSECTTKWTKVYWAFEIRENISEVTIKVPKGGVIIKHIRGDGYIVTKSYTNGSVTGTHLYVLGTNDY